MKITLDGLQVQDAAEEVANVAKACLPVPEALHKANSWMSPLGPAPGRGWLCMLRQDLDKLRLQTDNREHILTLQDEVGGLQNVGPIYYTGGTCLTPGKDAFQPDACFLTEWADARWLVYNPNYHVVFSRQFNVPAPNSGLQYYGHSKINDDVDWSWELMAKDIWSTMAQDVDGNTILGPWPGLPKDLGPDTKPTGFQYIGVPAWMALCDVLERLSCAVTWTGNKAQPFIIVQVGSFQDKLNDPIFANAAKALIYDAYPLECNRTKYPAAVAVFFNTFYEHHGAQLTTSVKGSDGQQWQTDNSYVYRIINLKDLGFNIANPQGAIHSLWDDELAILDEQGIILNDISLRNRAADRVRNYYLGLLNSSRGYRIYSGVHNFRPGSAIRGVCWREFPDQSGKTTTELATEIVQYPKYVRVTDGGKWEPCDHFGQSVTMRPPDFNPTWPLYPPLEQLVTLDDQGPVAPGVYTGRFTQAVPFGNGLLINQFQKATVYDANAFAG